MSAEDELQEVQEQLQGYWNKLPPFDTLSLYLRISREARIKNAELVAKYGTMLIKHYKSKLAEEELWLVYEQVAVAAMECNSLSTAANLIKQILQKFPGSIRARRLQGMYYEAVGRDERAEEIYKLVIGEEPSNEIIAKRMVAMQRGRGDLTGAIATLRQYLDHYMNDRESWEELADLYLEACMYRQAAFCYEELITFLPGSANYCIRYADILMTIGGQSHVRAARAYYSKAVALSQGKSVRALMGLLAAGAALGADAKGESTGEQLPAAAGQMLQKLYGEQAPDKLPVLEQVLKQLKITSIGSSSST